MAQSELHAMIKAVYVAREGARSILGYMDRNITSGIADLVLDNSSAKGAIEVKFDASRNAIALIPQSLQHGRVAVAQAV